MKEIILISDYVIENKSRRKSDRTMQVCLAKDYTIPPKKEKPMIIESLVSGANLSPRWGA